MFGRKTPGDTTSTVPMERVRAIAGTAAPGEYKTAGGSRHRTPRAPVYKRGIVQGDDGDERLVTIRNLSVAGCRLEYSGADALPDRVLLKEPTLQLALWGVVKWQGDGACGIEFESDGQDLSTMSHVAAATPAAVAAPSAPRQPKLRRSRSPLRKT